MDRIIKETIDDFIRDNKRPNRRFYWGESDLRIIRNCENALVGIYNRMLSHGLTKNVFMAQQLLAIVNKLEKLTQ